MAVVAVVLQVEAPYQTVPANPMARRPVPVPGTNPLLRVHVVPGLKQPKPAEVMRGEETQIAGFLSLNPRWDGVICLPGTHTKWAQISAGEVVSFRTAMTGEMFALLSEKSVLRHSVAEGWDDEAFHDAVDRAMSRPESLMTDLFGLRAQDLLHAQSSAVGRGRLSGLLIGAELAAVKPYWIGQQLAVIGASGLSGIYAKALDRQGVPVTIADGTKMTLAGLAAAERDLET
ncbi:MAG: 2-dehydro-3-deoxygalactonokinase [Pseudomonadota bacterium]